MNTNAVRAGEPITLTVTLKGEGNYVHLIPPKLERAPGWQIFPPALDAGPVYYSATVARRIFTYALIPLSVKATRTPAIPFCYFDPSNRVYVNLTIPSLPIQVLPAPAGGRGAAARGGGGRRGGARAEETTPEPKEPTLTGLVDTLGASTASLRPLQERTWFSLPPTGSGPVFGRGLGLEQTAGLS